MGLAPSSLPIISHFFEIMNAYTSQTIGKIITPKRSRSMRKFAWYVTPKDASPNEIDDDTQCANWVDKRGKVLCGHLFNGNAERKELGLDISASEECPISLEPIADARLPFGNNICVQDRNPELTGVQLVCGHRFNASFLLWHWALNPMICPICRAKYNADNGETIRPCKVENFPRKFWTKLRAKMREQKREEDLEEIRLIESYHTESIVDTTIETVLGPSQQFFLMLSLNTIDGRSIIQYMPLYRTNNNLEAISDDSFQFSVQRSALRRFTSAVSYIDVTTPATSDAERVLKASVVLRIGDEDEEQSYLYRVAQMADVKLPAFRLHDRTVHAIPTIQSTEDILISEAADLLLQLQAPRTGFTDPVLSDAVATVTTADTMGYTPTTRTSTYRYTTIDTHCMDMNGVLTMEMCEEFENTGIDSLHAIRLNLQACSLMSEVARCFSSV